MNLYAYVHNQPLRYLDPDGRFACVFVIPVLEMGAAGATALGLPSLSTLAYAAATATALYFSNEILENLSISNICGLVGYQLISEYTT